ncbi:MULTISPECIES: ORF6C domain-containing protein [Bacillus cereus group]|uniref:ORF6C domain-containing protein n=1 Tax=Bacillus cereus group TaxID=86661 RepID=UPI001F5A1BD4|nr:MULTISPECIES: ORF6C domain-containing protein [unclassified Bacillus cereus group]
MDQLQILEFNDQRVLTTKQLAEVYGCTETHVKQNFNNHKEKFEKNKHYILLKGEELRVFKRRVDNIYLVPNNVNQLYLWTERGANRHCKILDTDKAWEQFDHLEETYFKVRERQQQLPTDPMSVLKLTFQALEGQQQEIEEIKSDVQDLKENTPLFAIECDEISNAVKRKGVVLLGGKQSNAYRDRGLRGKVYRDIYNQLYREFGVKSHKAIKRCHLNIAIKIVEEYTLPIVLSEKISFINAQMDFIEIQ